VPGGKFVAVDPFITKVEAALPLMVPVPLQVKLPVAGIVRVLPFKLSAPEVRDKLPLTVNGPFMVTPFVLLMVRLFTWDTVEGIFTPAEEPPNTRLEEDVVDKLVGVPAMEGPFSVSVLAPTAKVPDVNVNVPAKVVDPFIVTPFVLLIVRLLSWATVEGIAIPAELPPKTRFVKEVVERFAGVPAIAGPFRVRVLAPTAKVPLLIFKVPLTVRLPPALFVPLVLPSVRLL